MELGGRELLQGVPGVNAALEPAQRAHQMHLGVELRPAEVREQPLLGVLGPDVVVGYREGMEDQLGVLGLDTGPRRARAGRASDPRGLAGRP
ncbi:hypothetical protein [Streptomyces phaeochromogenes]|uniref:hypothetical protein n=1 Tax=Streptomyces phaeochromogenes TaxID=1923 RepID=UPI002E157364|nr:hypothetical protein OG437_50470 [Streptomyces phaeochromogenes]